MTKLDRANWMKYLDPAAKVIDSYIPASHDSAAYDLGSSTYATVIHNVGGSITQAASFSGQLAVGSRYFDMRITRAGDDLKMKHGMDATFASFGDVLCEISAWAHLHPTEFIFMDLDFDASPHILEPTPMNSLVLQKLLSIISVDKFTDLHVGSDGMYNKALTWGDLQKGYKQFIVIWPNEDSGKKWAPFKGKIRYNLSDDHLPADKDDPYSMSFDFTEHKAPEIVAYLDTELGRWTKDKLFLTQVIDTPSNSFKNHPVELDEAAAPTFTAFITKKAKGDHLGIVKRDFVNAKWSREAFDHIIMLNDFVDNKSPQIPKLGRPINLTDTIRLKTVDGGSKYLRVEKSADSPHHSYLKLFKGTPDEACNIVIRGIDYSTKQHLKCSGNKDADFEHGAPTGATRLIYWPADSEDGDTVYAYSVDTDGELYWGVTWDASHDLESFLFFDKNDFTTQSNVRDGSEVLIRSMSDYKFVQAWQDSSWANGVTTYESSLTAKGDRWTWGGSAFKVELVSSTTDPSTSPDVPDDS